MSWNIGYVAKDRAAALAELEREDPTKVSMPSFAKAALFAAISAFPEKAPECWNGGTWGILVESSGHVHSTEPYGNAVQTVKHVRLI